MKTTAGPGVNTSSSDTPTNPADTTSPISATSPATSPYNSSTPVVNTNASAQPVSPEQLERESGREQENETFSQKFSRLRHNCWESTGLCCFTAKEQSQIAALEFQIAQRQKKFGVDYLTIVLAHQQELDINNHNAPQAPIAEALERCVQEAVSDIHLLQSQIDSRMVSIDQRTVEVNSRLQPAPGTPSSQPTTAAAVLIDEGVEATPDEDEESPASVPPATSAPTENNTISNSVPVATASTMAEAPAGDTITSPSTSNTKE